MSVQLLLVGLSFKTAPLQLRERLAVAEHLLVPELARLMEKARLKEGVLISTCNRVELVATCNDTEAAIAAIVEHFNQKAAPDRIDDCLYRFVSQEAVRHLFRVACGMEAMVVGEPQILGQVKQAFAEAQAAGFTGTLLGRLFDRAFTVAKRIRSETGIAEGCVSVSSVACNLADKIFGELSGRRVLLVGAGKMSVLSARALADRGARLTVINRNRERAEQLAKGCGGEIAPFDALLAELGKADVVISSTSSPGFVIDSDLMQEAARLRKRRPIFFIDIAVPRDIDPRVRSFDNVFLYDIDDLQQVSDANLEGRMQAVPAAEKMIDAAVEQYEKWLHSLQLAPTITALRERFLAVVQEEKNKTLPRLSSLSDGDRRSLDAMLDSLVNKLLHHPVVELKRSGDGKDATSMVEVTQRLFELDLPDRDREREKP